MKLCPTCNSLKEKSEFCKRKSSKDGLNFQCKSCTKEYYNKNKMHIAAKAKEHRELHKEELAVKHKAYYEANKQKKKEYDKEYRHINKEKIKQYKKSWEHSRKEESLFKIKRNLRRRIHHVLNGESKSASTLELLGCSFEEFILHIEQQFSEGMSWGNYGLYGWHIDHIIPCYKFDLTDPENQKLCFHYSNQRPLWAKDNLGRKRD